MKMIQVTISTRYIDEEIAFYGKYLGLSIQRDVRPSGRPIVFLGDPDAQTFVEIIQTDAEESGGKNITIGFHVPDIDALHDALAADGLEPTPFVTPAPGVRFFFVKDPAGVEVQVI